MARKKSNKRSGSKVGEKGVNRVTIVPKKQSGVIYLEWYEVLPDGRTKRRSHSLGRVSSAQATAEAERLSVDLRTRSRAIRPDELTVGQLFDIYEESVTPTKAKSTQGHDLRAMKLFRDCRGNETPVTKL